MASGELAVAAAKCAWGRGWSVLRDTRGPYIVAASVNTNTAVSTTQVCWVGHRNRNHGPTASPRAGTLQFAGGLHGSGSARIELTVS